MATQTLELGAASEVFSAAADHFERSNGIERLWARDASLWTGSGEEEWLGWLDLPETPQHELEALCDLALVARQEDVRQVVVLGMGGSTLCPDVLAHCFAPAPGHPRTLVLDSTVPAQIASLERAIDLDHSWFVVSSKSGGTIEPNMFLAYFHARVVEQRGEAAAGSCFVAITDPGSSLEAVARELDFRATLPGVASVGGRFSALSTFGLLPAALQGLDPGDWLARARRMAQACGPDVALCDNPGAALGVAIGALAAAGRNKLTLAISPGLAALGGWLEQLLAESTGKHGRGVVPIDGEPLPSPVSLGDDRLFVYTRLATAPCPEQDAAIATLATAGQPVVRIDIADPLDLAAELFRWEFATAVSGAVLELNPFDQPDVEAAKGEARSLMASYERDGALPDADPILCADGLGLFSDAGLMDTDRADAGVGDVLRDHLARVSAGDYLAINAFVEMSAANAAPLERIRSALSRHAAVPTSLGYGPRFQHSTGQLHKGGPDQGVFLQLTSDDAEDLEIPGQRYSFGVLKQAQALGDFAVLCERGRRALRIHLPGNITHALTSLADRVERELGA